MSTATVPVFASAGEAMAMVHAGLSYLAFADATAMSAEERDVNPAAFGDLIRLCAQLDKLLHGSGGSPFEDSQPGDDADGTALDVPADADALAAFRTCRSRELLEQAIIGKAVELLSGPGGLASFLRRKQLRAILGGPSLPLDIGYARTVPAGIRNAARLRGMHCEWAGGCSQPASACQVHHTRHKADGGPTSLVGCVLAGRGHGDGELAWIAAARAWLTAARAGCWLAPRLVAA